MRIQPTLVRIALLKILLQKKSDTFSIEDITAEKDKANIMVSKTAVTNTLRLFQVRGLLLHAGERKFPHRGRPEVLFKVSAEFLNRHSQ